MTDNRSHTEILTVPSVKDNHTLSAAAGRERLAGRANTAIDILPIVRHPNVACGIDVDVDLHLQATPNISARRRNLIAGLHTGRTVLSADAA